MTTEEIIETLETAKTEITGKRFENAWQLLDRLIRDLERDDRDQTNPWQQAG